MSRLLKELLGEDGPDFALGLTRLERVAGAPGVDARLVGEIMTLSHAKVRALSLDPNDTTGAELYAALRAEIFKADEHLMAFFGHPASGEELVSKITQWVMSVVGQREVWVVKDTTLKAIYKKNPPKAVMKTFHYTSLDSMLKRMPTAHIALASRVLESKTWWHKTHKLYAALQSKDFQKSSLEIVPLTDTKWQKVLNLWRQHKGSPVIGSKECGLLGVGYQPGPCPAALVAPLAVHAANELALHGAFMKLHYVNPSQGQVLVDMLLEGSLVSGSVSSSVFHWRDMVRYYGMHVYKGETSFAHLESSDLVWLRSEVVMASYVPELSYWAGTDFVGVSYGPGRVISLNLHDVATSVNAELDYKTAGTHYLCRALRSELMARYIKQPPVRALVSKLFDISGVVDDNDW